MNASYYTPVDMLIGPFTNRHVWIQKVLFCYMSANATTDLINIVVWRIGYSGIGFLPSPNPSIFLSNDTSNWKILKIQATCIAESC